MTYSEISLTELLDLENAVVELLPTGAFSPALSYTPVTDPQLAFPTPIDVILFPAPKSVQRQNSVDLEKLMYKAGQVPHPADVVNFTTGRTPNTVNRWFLCLKLDTFSPEIQQAIPISAWALEMPYTAMVRRPTVVPETAGGLDIFGAPNSVDTSGYPTFTTTGNLIHFGMSNQFNPLVETVAGALPKGQMTAYTYLNAPVQLDDALTVNGKHYAITQINDLDSDGFIYGLLLLLTETGGQTYAGQ
jgi:hypothetical protein